MQQTGLETQTKVGRKNLLTKGNIMIIQCQKRNMKKGNIRETLN